MEFLDKKGVQILWNKIKSLFGLGDTKNYLQDFLNAGILMGETNLIDSIKKVINITDKVAIYAFIFKKQSNKIQLSYKEIADKGVIGTTGEFNEANTAVILVPFAIDIENSYNGSSSEIWVRNYLE
jgi:hypothetical protein